MGVVAHDGETLYLVRQPREPVGEPALLELPAGKLDEEGESPLDTAQRELAEEIGKGARTWQHLTSFYTSPGFADEECHLFMATDLYDQEAEADENERIEIVEVPLSRARPRDPRLPRLEDARGPAVAAGVPAAESCRTKGWRAARPNHGRGHHREADRRAPVRAPGARLPRLPRVRARAVPQHARRVPHGPVAVRSLPGGARASALEAGPARRRRLPRVARDGGARDGPPRRRPIHRKSACLRSFYRHLRRDGLLDTDPTATLSAPRRTRKLPHVLTRGEIEKLLTQPRGTEPAALRDRALLELMYACGLRASEAIGLELMDVDLQEGVLRARGKGSKERVVPIGQAALGAVRIVSRARAPRAREGRARRRTCS